MRVLFDVVHPAHVLFFRAPIKRLQSGGATVAVASRRKDITTELLDELGISHEPLSTAGTGVLGLAAELLMRDLRMLRTVRQFRPHVLVGFGGVAIAHAGAFLGIPTIAFYDSEPGRLQTALALPFIDSWHVPETFLGPAPRGRTHRFAGIKALSYLHPSVFSPDTDRAIEAGWDPEQDNFLVRLVGWRAAHDRHGTALTRSGWSAVVEGLARRGKVHVSVEGTLPDRLADFRYRGARSDLHHLVAHSKLVVGESATLASEAATLGIPAIFVADFRLGYIDDLAKAGLVIPLRGPERLEAAIDELLSRSPHVFTQRRDRWLANQINVADYVVSAILKLVDASTLEKHATPGT